MLALILSLFAVLYPTEFIVGILVVFFKMSFNLQETFVEEQKEEEKESDRTRMSSSFDCYVLRPSARSKRGN